MSAPTPDPSRLAAETPAALHDRLAFEVLVADVSASFVNLPSDRLDAALDSALERIGRFLGVERAATLEVPEGGRALTPTHAWAEPGTRPFPRSAFDAQTHPWIQDELREGRTVAVSGPADLPADAAADRQLLENLEIRSFLSLPLAVAGDPIGALGFVTSRREVSWSDDLLRRLRLLSEVFANAISRQRSERELSRRSSFDTLLADLSASLLRVAPEELDEQIASGLQRISTFLGVDRSTIFRLDADGESVRPTHTWHADGIPPPPPLVRTDIFQWLQQKAAAGDVIAIRGPDDLPPDATGEIEFLKALGITSFATVPMSVGGSYIGGVSLLTVARTFHWTPEVVQRLRLISEVFASAIARQMGAARLHQRQRFEGLLLELSARLTHLPAADLGPEVDRGLEVAADYLGLDRVTFAEFSDRGDALVVTHCFSREGVDNVVGRDLHRAFPPYAEMLLRGEPVKMARLPANALLASHFDTLPLEGERGIKSHAALPIVTGGRIFGVLGLTSFARYQTWSDDRMQRLELIGRIFASALARRRSDIELQAAYVEIRDLSERLRAENVVLREELAPRSADGIVGQSAVLHHVLRQVERVGATDTTVLLTGETGTGKELVAEAIHAMSGRQSRAMVRVNCAALPATLIESELFGREKGAFTGATARQAGRFEAADQSTLFLDEIAELPLEIQAKLLRVLEEGRFERLGSTRTIEVDVRIVAATNRNLEAEVAEGRFREDLYYRLEVFPIHVPPLRERREDVPLLVWAFARDYAERLGKHIESISKAHMEQLQDYPWPGNVRELRNVVERAVILSDGPVLDIQLPETRGSRTSGRTTLDEVQTEHIRSILEQTGWRVRGDGGAAAILGLKPTTLEYRMKRLGIRRPSPA